MLFWVHAARSADVRKQHCELYGQADARHHPCHAGIDLVKARRCDRKWALHRAMGGYGLELEGCATHGIGARASAGWRCHAPLG